VPPSLAHAVPAEHQPRQQTLSSVPAPLPRPKEPNADLTRSLVADTSELTVLLTELGIEPSLTIREASAILRWSHWKTRRHFRQVDGICVSYQPKRYKRPYRTFTIPLSIFAREWQRMTGREPEALDVIRRRLKTAIQR
jgi:hypothetical protein